MKKSIHWRIIKRLLLAWLALSAVLGGLVFYVEMEKVDDFVVGLAVKESESFTGDMLHHINNQDAEGITVLRQRLAEFLKSHFIVVELYDRNKRKVLEDMDPGKESAEAALSKLKHSFPLGQSLVYYKHYIGNRVYMQVLLPIREQDGSIVGYFEGVYEVDDATMGNISQDIARTLVFVVVVILVTSIVLYPIILLLNRGLLKLSQDLLRGNIELMEVLGSAIAKRDSDTNIHNYRVTIYAIRLAEAMGLSSDAIRNLTAGAFLHDVGKIGISDNILLKPGKLTDEEFELMRTHVTLGMDIIAKSNWLQNARDVVEYHHEKFDGSGYMRGLQGEDIPLNARIFAIVDVFDALTSRRPYKEPWGCEEALSVLERDSGSHFDPKLVAAFKQIAPRLHQAVSQAEDRTVEAMLNDLVTRHFFAST